MTKKRKEPEAPDAGTPPTLIDLAKQMEAAVGDVEIRRQAVDGARVALETATASYAAAVETVNALHQQYEAIVQNVLSHGGTVHIAKG